MADVTFDDKTSSRRGYVGVNIHLIRNDDGHGASHGFGNRDAEIFRVGRQGEHISIHVRLDDVLAIQWADEVYATLQAALADPSPHFRTISVGVRTRDDQLCVRRSGSHTMKRRNKKVESLFEMQPPEEQHDRAAVR